MLPQLFQYKPYIEKELRTFLRHKQKELAEVNTWGIDVCKRMESFCLAGKMLRGCLTVLGYEMFGKKASRDVILAASAMELIQSGLLIHDDIMDRDATRRGMDTLATQYRKIAQEQKAPEALHFGESMAICAGDLGFFLAFELLPKSAAFLTAKEIANVCVAQMQDMAVGSQKSMPDETDILSLYRFKTARYTFSLPLMLGAVLAGQSKKTIRIIEKLGEHLGIMFQMKDDALDFESDHRERKKTLLLLDKGDGSKTAERMVIQAAEATTLIAQLPVDAKYRRMLEEILEYNRTRTQ